MISDDEIIASVLGGRVRDFESLIRRYQDKIFHFVNRMIHDEDEAVSLAQDVFVKIYETLDRYKSRGNFQAFIFRVAKNHTLNYIKKRKRTMFFSGSLDRSTEGEYFSRDSDQMEKLEAGERERLINDGLARLKEAQKISLILKVYLGFSYKRISEITGWSVPKVETLIFRAKNNLKEYVSLQEKQFKNVNMVRES